MHVDVERPIHIRVRALDEYGEPITIEASGLEARVIQHEIDHLDGVLVLDRISRQQRKEAMRALREAQPPAPRRCRVRTVYLGTSEFAADVLRPWRPRRTAPRSSSPALTGRAAEGRKLTRRRWPTPPASSGSSSTSPMSVNDPRRARRIAAVAPEAVCVCAFGALIKEPLLSDYEMLNVHPSLLPRWRGAAPVERAIMAGDEAPGSRSCASPRVLTAGRCAAGAGADRADGHLRDAGRAPRRSRRRAAGRALDAPPPCRRAGRGRGHLRRQAHRRGPPP